MKRKSELAKLVRRVEGRPAKRTHKKEGANFTPAYWRTDPDLAQVVMILTNSPEKKRAIQDSKGVTTQTLNNWCSGRTKRPYNVTLSFVMEGLGYRRKWEKAE